MLKTALWPGIVLVSFLLVASGLVASQPDAKSAMLSLSQATSCLFQYDVVQTTFETAAR
ncbi:hypothetical protein [Acetobacter tropicalis]|uniref:hypothetical protein n=1 Tax=Acetobacter tropicalis TaxID=104102 RepID=UPI000A3FA8BD|nr:hypothetical protein [Acetobacter tropicalis]